MNLIAKPLPSESFGEKELIPLFKKALTSITENPIFYPHGMGYDLYPDLALNLKKHGKMDKFDYIPLYKTWDMLTKIQQEQFKIIATNEKNLMKYNKNIQNLNLALTWKLSRSNRNLNVMCCGEACKIVFRPKINEFKIVRLAVYKINNTYDCGIGYNFPFETWHKYNREQWRSYHGLGILQDANCDGNLPDLNFNDDETEEKFRKLYKDIFKIIDPIKTLNHSPIEQCDV